MYILLYFHYSGWMRLHRMEVFHYMANESATNDFDSTPVIIGRISRWCIQRKVYLLLKND